MIICCVDWTAVSAIASAVMIIITGISIICNNRQNKHNREASEYQNNQNRDIQIKTIKYQSRLDWLNLLKREIVNLGEVLRFDIVDRFIGREHDANNNLISECINKVNTAKASVIATLIGHNLPKEIQFITTLDIFIKRYIYFLFDLEFYNSLDFDISREEMKETVHSYMVSKRGTGFERNRIWSIIALADYKSDSINMSSYLNRLIKEYHFEEFETSYLDLIRYEYTLANNIINGTEQHK